MTTTCHYPSLFVGVVGTWFVVLLDDALLCAPLTETYDMICTVFHHFVLTVQCMNEIDQTHGNPL